MAEIDKNDLFNYLGTLSSYPVQKHLAYLCQLLMTIENGVNVTSRHYAKVIQVIKCIIQRIGETAEDDKTEKPKKTPDLAGFNELFQEHTDFAVKQNELIEKFEHPLNQGQLRIVKTFVDKLAEKRQPLDMQTVKFLKRLLKSFEKVVMKLEKNGNGEKGAESKEKEAVQETKKPKQNGEKGAEPKEKEAEPEENEQENENVERQMDKLAIIE